MRILKLTVVGTLASLSFSVFATGIAIQSATQSINMGMGTHTQAVFVITNNTGENLTGLDYTMSSSSFANMTPDTGCSSLNAGASCFFTEGMATGTTGSAMMGAPKVCIDGAACWQPTSHMLMTVTPTNSLVCWGYNTNGQIGNGSITQPNRCNNGGSCANTAYYALTNGSTGGSTQLHGIQQVTTGAGFSCALMTNGTEECWGDNNNGELGNNCSEAGCNAGVNQLDPKPVCAAGTTATSPTCTPLTGIQFISSGTYGNFAVLTNGNLYGWGNDAENELSISGNTGNPNPTPVQISNISNVSKVSAGYRYVCALKTDGTVWCWGENNARQANPASATNPITTPTQITGGGFPAIQFVNSGSEVACALSTDDHVWCWGDNTYGELGQGDTSTYSIPVEVKGVNGSGFLSNIQSIMAGGSHQVCAVATDGTAYCWGNGAYGELGNGSTASSLLPTQVLASAGVPLTGVQAVSLGNYWSCALMINGGEKCFGANGYGQMGNGSATLSFVYPVSVLGPNPSTTSPLTNLTGSSQGEAYYHACAIITNP